MEQSGQPNPVEVIAFDPGMVDTELQAVARGKSAEEFALSGLFNEVYESGQLQSASVVAEQLMEQLEQ
jgi:benzil reductase ((S)-benzoin forming)